MTKFIGIFFIDILHHSRRITADTQDLLYYSVPSMTYINLDYSEINFYYFRNFQRYFISCLSLNQLVEKLLDSAASGVGINLLLVISI